MDNTIKKNLEGAISYVENLEKQIKTLNNNLLLIRGERNELRRLSPKYQNINNIDLSKIDFAHSGLLEGKVTSEVEGGRFIEEETFDNYNAMLRYLNISSYNVDANTAMKKIKEYSNTTDHKEITLKIKNSSRYIMYFKNYQ